MCEHRMVPCPEYECCTQQQQLPLRCLLGHIQNGKETDHVDINDEGFLRSLNVRMTSFEGRECGWACKILKYQNQLFLASASKEDGIYYFFVYILAHLEEARKFKVTLSIGQGTQSGIIHTGKIFPIDAKKVDIMKEKSGVISFHQVGMGETFFTDAEDQTKEIEVHIKIGRAMEPNGVDVCKFNHCPSSITLVS